MHPVVETHTYQTFGPSVFNLASAVALQAVVLAAIPDFEKELQAEIDAALLGEASSKNGTLSRAEDGMYVAKFEVEGTGYERKFAKADVAKTWLSCMQKAHEVFHA